MSDFTLAVSRPSQLSRSRANELVRPRRPGPDRQQRPRLTSLPQAQARLEVGPAHDPFEEEAERTADVVTRQPTSRALTGTAPVAAPLLRLAQRAVEKGQKPVAKDEEEKKRKAQKSALTAGGPSVVPAGVEHGIARLRGAGATLDASVRARLEPRFGFDFSEVRVHTGREAAGAALRLGARAFTVGQDIFFAAGQYQPRTPAGLHLIAHELTHTIQQTPGAARARMIATAGVRAQRWEGPLDKIRAKVRAFLAEDFPPWELITLVIGYDPIRDAAVKGSTRDWMRAAMKLVPERLPLFERLDKEGKVDAVAKWWDGEVAKLDLTLATIQGLVKKAWDALSLDDARDVVGAWTKKIKPIFLPVVTRVWNFIKAVGAKVLAIVKELVLKQLADWAKTQKGYPLLTMVLRRDPVTGEPVTPTLKGVIFAVLDLVDETGKVKENLEKSKTVEKAATWFKAEVKKLDLSWEGIKLLFVQAWQAFSVADLLKPVALFDKMRAIFGPTVGRLLRFLLAVGEKVLEFVVEGAMLLAGPIGLQIVGILRKIGATFKKIVNDPVRFLAYLIHAVKKGMELFSTNIWEHLKTGVINWLVASLEGAGLVLPKVWDVRGILDLALQVLGISYPKVRVKLVKVLGEKTVAMLEQVFTFIKTLIVEGPAAAWQEIVAAIGSLWDMIIGGIKDWAVTKIVTAAITKIATMLNPAGAVIQAVIAIYNTVAFFVERIKQIAALVEAIVDSIANIAEGKLDAAAKWVEKTMARAIPVILGFLARLIGLGDVSGAIKKVITTIQQKVDKGIDAVIAWVVAKAKSLVGKKEKPVSAHEALLRDILTQLEEDEPESKDDEGWLSGKRAKAAKLAAESKPKLPTGVGISIVINPGTLPRQFTFDMKIAPNNTTLSGQSPPSPVLTFGETYAYFLTLQGRNAPGLGKYHSVDKLNGQWVLWLIPLGERETERSTDAKGNLRGKFKGRFIVPAYKPDLSPNYRLASAASAEPPVFRPVKSRTAFRGGLQPVEVAAEPLAQTSTYSAPREVPPGLQRISAKKWVAGHLVNGTMGGPGTNENLVPITETVNAKMRGNYENALRAKLQTGTYFFFNAKVDYYKSATIGGVGHAEDFVEQIRVEYEEATKQGTAWTKTPGTKKSAGPFDVPLPKPSELETGRLGS